MEVVIVSEDVKKTIFPNELCIIMNWMKSRKLKENMLITLTQQSIRFYTNDGVIQEIKGEFIPGSLMYTKLTELNGVLETISEYYYINFE